MNGTFNCQEVAQNDAIFLKDGHHRLYRSHWCRELMVFADDASHYGIVIEGRCRLECTSGVFLLNAGMYFSVPGTLQLNGNGRALVISKNGYQGLFHLGGPVEGSGRLGRIDGCSNTVLIPPVKLGDPWLSLLHIPPFTQRTLHTHSSIRLGLVIRGSGQCETPEGKRPLHIGLSWSISRDSLHGFTTGDESLTIVAFHPDSDFGPGDHL